MLLFLPILQFAGTALVIQRNAGPGACWRLSLVRASLVWGVLLTVCTEVLSVFNALHSGPVALFWAAFSVPGLLSLARTPRWPTGPRRPFRRTQIALAAPAVLMLVVTGTVAAMAPPNTRDSISYHLSRVCHWGANGSVANYPTHILRQLHLAPWSEYAILHLQLLTGGDRAANLVQWASFAGCMLGVSLVAKRLGATGRFQAVSALFVATLPMGILQASGTQNDLVVSFWLACFIALLPGSDPSVSDALFLGASLGLAVLTKGTAFFVAAPFVLWLAYRAVFRRELRLLLVPLVVLVLGVGFFGRNWRLYGSPLGPADGAGADGRYRFANGAFDVPLVLSNILRNVALHTATEPALAPASLRIVERAHSAIGLSSSDPRNTWFGTRFSVPAGSRHEDYAGNPVHFLFVVLATGWLAFRRRGHEAAFFYSTGLVVSFLLFCAVLKWQPWHSRLHLPLFVLAAPVVAMLLEAARSMRLVAGVAVLWTAQAIPFVLWSETRPAAGPRSVFRTDRLTQYFVSRPEVEEDYTKAAAMIRESACEDVGLILGLDGEEYFLWVVTGENRRLSGRIRHVNVSNVSKRFEGEIRRPCIVLADRSCRGPIRIHGNVMQPVWSSGGLCLYGPQRPDATDGAAVPPHPPGREAPGSGHGPAPGGTQAPVPISAPAVH